MADFPIHAIADAPAEARPVLEDLQRDAGYVPNLFAIMATAPALLEGYVTLQSTFLGSATSLSHVEKQVVLMSASVENGCTYCVAGHTAVSVMQRVPDDVIAGIRDDTPLADAKLQALRHFVQLMVKQRGWVDDADVTAFLAAGYTQRNVLEVVLGIAVKTASNYTNHLADTPVDAGISRHAWPGRAGG